MHDVSEPTDATTSSSSQLPPSVELDGLRQTLAWQAQPLQFLHDCAQRYGDAFTLDFGSHGSYAMFSTPQAIRTIFNADDGVLHAGKGNRVLGPLLGAGSLLLLEEQHHLSERRLLLPGFHGQVIERYADLIQCAALDVMADVDAHRIEPDEEIAVQDLMQTISMRVILRAVFGIQAGSRFEELREQMQRVLNDPKLSLGLLEQLQNDLTSRAWQKFRDDLRRIDELLLEEVALRRAAGDAAHADLLGMLLAVTYEDGTKLDDWALRDELMTLIVTGYETTATALAWAFYWLAREPAVLERLRTELAPLGRHPTPACLAQAKYLHAVCQETLRIHPIIPVVAREVQTPIEIQGYTLPAGVTVAASIYLAHHRSEAFPDPERFRPERFLQRQPSPFEYLPFGGGVRRCIGMSLALYEMKIVLGSILAQYEFTALTHELRAVRRFVTLAPEGGAKLRIRRIPAAGS